MTELSNNSIFAIFLCLCRGTQRFTFKNSSQNIYILAEHYQVSLNYTKSAVIHHKFYSEVSRNKPKKEDKARQRKKSPVLTKRFNTFATKLCRCDDKHYLLKAFLKQKLFIYI